MNHDPADELVASREVVDRRHNRSPKDRIKLRAMETSSTSASNDQSSSNSQCGMRRRASLLDAASALAALGGDSSPPSPSLADDMRVTEESGVQDTANNGPPVGQSNAANEHPPIMSATGQIVPLSSLDIPMTFPEKLMEVLSNEQIADVVSWLPHGKGFVIVQKRRFTSEVMPLYFKQSKFTSFTRKLNRWGFTRVQTGPEAGAYYHQNFRRGNHLLCMQMHCQAPAMAASKSASSAKASTKRSSSSPTSSPQSSPPPMAAQDEDISKAADLDLVGPTTAEGSRAEGACPGSMASFDVVLERQRQLLKESRAARHRGDMSTVNVQYSGFDRVFDRQQQLLGTNNRYGAARQVSEPHDFLMKQIPTRFNHDILDNRGCERGEEPVCQAFGNREYSMQRQEQHQQRQHQQRHRQQQRSSFDDDVDRAVKTRMLLARSSRRHHRLIIESALTALKSCKAGQTGGGYPSVTKDNETSPQQQGYHNTPAPTPRLQADLHSAMQARLRRLEEYNRTMEDALKDGNGCQQRSSFSQFEVAQLRDGIRQRRRSFGMPQQQQPDNDSYGEQRRRPFPNDTHAAHQLNAHYGSRTNPTGGRASAA